MSFGKSFWEYWGASVAYNFEKVKIYNVRSDASSIVKDQEGTQSTSSITTSIGRDTRDNYLDPLKGSKNAVSLTFAGLGGTNAFLKGLLDSGWYLPVFDVTTVHLRGRVGYASALFGKNFHFMRDIMSAASTLSAVSDMVMLDQKTQMERQ